jgi:NADPH:quinone reductase-like Zn-dependent oxidoreductase
VRVSIRAAALNHLDIFVRDGIPGVTLPLIPGADGAGVVDAVGTGVEGLAPGDRVLLQPGLYCNECEFCRAGEQSLCVGFRILGEHVSGTFAEAVVVPARNVFPMPERLSFEQAAAFPLVYQTAWRMIITRGDVRPGQTVLIHGAGGGAGGAALEVAKLVGARVFATTSGEEKAQRLAQAGAEVVIDYGKQDVAKEIRALTGKRGVDVVIDSVGDRTWMTSLKCAAKGGRIVTCGATTGPNPKEELRLVFWNQLSILGSTMANDREFRAMLSAVRAGKLMPRIDGVFAFSRAREAYERMEKGDQHGKIILVPDSRTREWPDGD